MNRPDAGRAGLTAVEAIVALLLGLFVVHLGLATLSRMRAVQDRLAIRTDGLVAMRVARHVLRRELRHGLGGQDWWALEDSLALRAFRGTALVCPPDSGALELTVLYSGDRLPNPSKDSVLLLDPLGGRHVRALAGVAAASGSCALDGEGPLSTWRLDAPVASGAVVARLFERGSYHLNDGALRYRRGLSGRQPLTPLVYSGATAWRHAGARLGLSAEHADTAAGRPWSAFLGWVDAP